MICLLMNERTNVRTYPIRTNERTEKCMNEISGENW